MRPATVVNVAKVSGSSRPVRRHPARVYRVRRGLVVGVAVFLVWVAVSATGGAGEPAAESAAEPGAAATVEPTEPTDATEPTDPAETAGAKDSGPSTDDASERGLQGPTLATARLGKPERECPPASVVVEPDATEGAVAGEPVELRLRVGTSSASPCRFDVTAADLLVQVTDGGDEPVWDTTLCPDSLPAQEMVLAPGWEAVLHVIWSGHHVDRSCSVLAAPADPGRYAVQAAVIGGEPGRSRFVLVPQPPPEPGHDAREGGGGPRPGGDAGDDQT